MKICYSLVAGFVALASVQVFAAEGGSNKTVVAAPTVKKVLVVCYSRTGHTKKIAELIAAALKADVEVLVDKKDRSGASGYMGGGREAMKEIPAEIESVVKDPAQYDLVVLGTPIWAWNMSPALRTYIIAHKAAFKNIAVFTSSGGSKPDKVVAKIEALAGKNAIASEGFYDREYSEKKSTELNTKITAFAGKLK